MYICLDIRFLFYLFFFCGIANKISKSGNKYSRRTYEQNANQRSSATALTKKQKN